MNERKVISRLALTLAVMLLAAPSMADQKVTLFNPFTLQSETVIAADSTPSVQLLDLLLLAEGDSTALTDGDPRPTVSLRGNEIRIPQRPRLRSAFSTFPPFAASIW